MLGGRTENVSKSKKDVEASWVKLALTPLRSFLYTHFMLTHQSIFHFQSMDYFKYY
jgi:hypothetical protein